MKMIIREPLKRRTSRHRPGQISDDLKAEPYTDQIGAAKEIACTGNSWERRKMVVGTDLVDYGLSLILELRMERQCSARTISGGLLN